MANVGVKWKNHQPIYIHICAQLTSPVHHCWMMLLWNFRPIHLKTTVFTAQTIPYFRLPLRSYRSLLINLHYVRPAMTPKLIQKYPWIKAWWDCLTYHLADNSYLWKAEKIFFRMVQLILKINNAKKNSEDALLI